MTQEIEISYSPYSYFLKAKSEELPLGVFISIAFHVLIVVLAIYLPTSKNTKNAAPARKGLGSLPVVVWNGMPQKGGVILFKNESTALKVKPSSTVMQLPNQKIISKTKETNETNLFKLANKKFIVKELDIYNPRSGFVAYPAGTLNGTQTGTSTEENTENRNRSTRASDILKDDEYVYTSFFNRLKDNLYPLWVGKVRSRISESDLRFIPAAKTRLLVRADESGIIQKVEQLESSGCGNCDDIAQASLLSLGKVTNPPKAFKQVDGLYDFKLTFTIYTQSSKSLIEVEPVEAANRWPQVR